MSYLLDRKAKRKKMAFIIAAVLLVLIIFYFRLGLMSGVSATFNTVLRPVFFLGQKVSGAFEGVQTFFASKISLTKEIEDLKRQNAVNQVFMLNHQTLLEENQELKEILGRKSEEVPVLLAGILAKPNQSPYDTLLIDVGSREGVRVGSRVFARGMVPMGVVVEAGGRSSKVRLFSSPGVETSVVVSDSDIFLKLKGRGGGDFEIAAPTGLVLENDSVVVLPGVVPYVVAIVEETISDPRDVITKILLRSPVNMAELKFVEVEI